MAKYARFVEIYGAFIRYIYIHNNMFTLCWYCRRYTTKFDQIKILPVLYKVSMISSQTGTSFWRNFVSFQIVKKKLQLLALKYKQRNLSFT